MVLMSKKYILKVISSILLPTYVLSGVPTVLASESEDKDTGYANVTEGQGTEKDVKSSHVTDDTVVTAIGVDGDDDDDDDDDDFVTVSGILRQFAGPMDLNRAVCADSSIVHNWEDAIGAVMLPDGRITEDRALIEDRIGVSVRVLEDLINNAVCTDSHDESNLQQFIHSVRDYYMLAGNESNLYNPQKRFILTYVLKYLEDQRWKTASEEEKNNLAVLYGELIKINDEINKKVLDNAISNADDKRQNFLRRIFALIQFGRNSYTYSDSEIYNSSVRKSTGATVIPGLCNRGFACPEFSARCEYPTSALAHGETVVISLPSTMEFDEFLELIGLNRSDLKPRQSTHSTKVDLESGQSIEEKTKVGGVITSGTKMISIGNISYWASYLLPEALIKNISDFVSKMDFQYGIDVPINQFNPDDKAAARGHVLISFSKGFGRSIAIIKLEDCGPGETSVTGHTHGPSGKGNYLSATSHLRIHSQYETRLAMVCDLRYADKNDLMRKVEGVAKDTSVPVTCTKVDFSNEPVANADFNIPGVKFHRYNCGFHTDYGYVITDFRAFGDWCSRNGVTPEEYANILANNNKWLYTSRSVISSFFASDMNHGTIFALPKVFLDILMNAKECFTSQEHINSQGQELVHDWAEHAPITQAFIETGDKAFVDDDVANDLYHIPGVEFHRYNCGTHVDYGYVIRRPDEFFTWLEQQNFSDDEREIILKNNNKWLYVDRWSGNKAGSIRILPKAFLNVLLRAIDLFEAQRCINKPGQEVIHDWTEFVSMFQKEIDKSAPNLQ